MRGPLGGVCRNPSVAVEAVVLQAGEIQISKWEKVRFRMICDEGVCCSRRPFQKC